MLKRLVSVTIVVALALVLFALIVDQPAEAAEITKMTASDEMVELIKSMEGFAAKPYWDYGQWTVGFGTKCPEEHRERYTAEGIPPEEADALMRQLVDIFVGEVNSFMVRNQIQLNQQQFDALVSFVYNVGSSVLYNNDSTVIKAVLNGAEGNDFMFAIGQWCSAGGEFMQGLLRRRMIEAYMYLYGTYSETLPGSFCYVMYNVNGGKHDTRAQGYDSNLVAVPLSVPTREGYIFTGWYTEAEGGEKVTALDETTNGLTLYAHWKVGTQAPERPTDPETGVKVVVTGNSVSIRQDAGYTANIISHVYRGEKLTITGLTEKNSTLWGYCNKGWICLEYTDYYEVTGTERPSGSTVEEEIQVPVKATVLSTSGVTVYGGPHTSYPQTAALSEGDTITILEVTMFCNQLWGRYEDGWVRLNQKILLHDDQILAHSFTVKVTYYFLNVRSGPGMNYGAVAQLATGDEIEIFAVTQVDGVNWGRFTTGWVYLDGNTDFDAEQLPFYQNHSYGDWYCAQEASCSQYGQDRRDCEHCDHYELRQVPMTEHILGEWYTSKEGTCVEEGEETRDCRYCDHFETRVTTLGDHGFDEWYVSIEANCVTEGQETRDCRYCDHFETKNTGLGDHHYGEWTVTTAPGCETVGQEQRDCENCEHFETREIEATGHTYGEWTVTTAPGCETLGQEQRDCENCDHFETREIAATGHTYGEWVVTTAPGCETLGQEQRDCENCDHFETREIEATGHTYGEWVVTKVPTADEEGEERRDCENCDHFETNVLPVNPHSYGEWYVYREPTCAEPGEERRDCSHCDGYESRPIALKEHEYDAWFVSVEATCTVAGEEKRQCQNCDHFETRATEPKGHSFGEWTVSVEATCTAAGEEKRECQNCDHFETRATEITDHNFGQWTVTVEATCTAAGEEKRECQNCDHFETRATDLADHNYGQWIVTVEATCTAAGEEKRQCQACDHFETRATQLADHNLGQWYVSVAPGCETEGTECRNCTECAYFEERPLAANGHSYGQWYLLMEPTIDSEGKKCRECANCDAFETETLPPLPSVEKVYATITYNSYLNVRAGASSATAQRGVLYKGMVVEILEQKTVGSKVWGRIEFGWICLTGYTSLETVRELAVEDNGNKTYATVTCNSLTLRPAANSYITLQGNLNNGVRVRIYEIVTAGSNQWGRTAYGWICLTGYTTLEEEHVEHVYGDWYVSQAGNCVTADKERRDCTGCDHYEIRTGQLGAHSYGQWFVTQEASCAAGGEERRNCTLCDHFETRTTAATGDHVFGGWYVAVAPGCEEAGTQCRDCTLCDHFENREIPAVGHSMSQWLVTKPATCTADGQQQRHCANCDYAETETIGAMGHSFGQWYTAIEPTADKDGQKCRECANCDLIETETLPAYGAVDKVYATITYDSYLNVRASASTGAAQVGVLYKGVRVEILEQKTVGSKAWGRIEFGWICLTGYTTLETVREPIVQDTSDKTYATVTCTSLSIRPAANSLVTKLGTLNNGVRIRIYEIVTIGGNQWGRTSLGWIWLTGYTTLEVEEGHVEHSFGQWVITTNPGCDTEGSQRRDCLLCDHYETATIAAVGHSLGEWYTSAAPTCVNAGQKRRQCANCDHVETAQIAALGHSFGEWYVSKQATTEASGQERRDCKNCSHYETRDIPMLPVTGQKVYGTFTGSGYLNIREGAGTTYTAVGKLYAGNRVEILEQVDVNGTLWGRIEGGWVCITGYIKLEYEQETVITITKLYATITNSYLTIRQNAGSSYSKVGTLSQGDVVQILEIRVVSGTEWGRIESGWICLTGYTTLATATEEVTEGDSISLSATVTYSFLRVRKDTNTSAQIMATLDQGAKVEILEIRTVSGKNWGRVESGWILLTGNATLSTPTSSGSGEETDEPNLEFTTGVADTWFENVLFIGDSRYVGLKSYARSGNADYFCDVGMTVFNYSGKTLSDKNFSNMTLQQLLASRTYDKIFFNFGLNEAGYSASYFISKYQALVDFVKAAQPDAILILNGIMSVTPSKASQASYFTPAYLASLSAKIEAMCDGKKIFYIDCNEYFSDSEGYLYSSLTGDGYHPTVYGYRKWRDWIAFAVEKLGI